MEEKGAARGPGPVLPGHFSGSGGRSLWVAPHLPAQLLLAGQASGPPFPAAPQRRSPAPGGRRRNAAFPFRPVPRPLSLTSAPLRAPGRFPSWCPLGDGRAGLPPGRAALGLRALSLPRSPCPAALFVCLPLAATPPAPRRDRVSRLLAATGRVCQKQPSKPRRLPTASPGKPASDLTLQRTPRQPARELRRRADTHRPDPGLPRPSRAAPAHRFASQLARISISQSYWYIYSNRSWL